MATAAKRLGDFISTLGTNIPENVRHAAALHVLDTFGCGLGAFALGESRYAAAAVAEDGVTVGPATAIGFAESTSPTNAAFVNGTLFHTLDFDDTHPNSVMHVSTAVVPAALAAAQAAGASGADLVAAIVAGNETSIRVGSAASGLFHARGFHPTGVCGVFGATAAAARARGLDGDTTAHALGIAGSMASGLLEFLADGSATKPMHAGWAAQAGITAARLAAHGATGPATVFEGVRGFFATYMHGQEVDFEAQVSHLGSRWLTPDIAFKPYPACHYTHAPVDALAAVLADSPLGPDDVESIVAITDASGVALVCTPAEDKAAPRTPYDAKFSLPYCLAYRLVHGRLDVTSFTADAISDPVVLALAARVSYELRQFAPRPDAFGGAVRVVTRDGRTLEHELRYQRGAAENPISDADVVDKYRTNASLALDADQVSALESAVLGLGAGSDLGFIAALGQARETVSV